MLAGRRVGQVSRMVPFFWKLLVQTGIQPWWRFLCSRMRRMKVTKEVSGFRQRSQSRPFTTEAETGKEQLPRRSLYTPIARCSSKNPSTSTTPSHPPVFKEMDKRKKKAARMDPDKWACLFVPCLQTLQMSLYFSKAEYVLVLQAGWRRWCEFKE